MVRGCKKYIELVGWRPRGGQARMIRCYECKHYNETRKNSGWCEDPKLPKRVKCDAVDHCDFAEKKEGGE